MRRVCVTYSKFATSKSGGARESLITLLCGLAEEFNINARVYQTPPADDPPEANFEYQLHSERIYKVPRLTWTNQVISRLQWGHYLRQHLKPNHDFLITQNELAPVSVQVADELNIPSLFFIRSMALTGCEKFDPNQSHISNVLQTDIGGRVQYPFLWKNYHDYKQAAVTATYTIANSEFTAAKINKLFDVEPTVIYPPIKLDNYKVDYDGSGYITMVNPRAEYKGADIFLDIAEEMTEEEFMLVGPISSESIKKRADNMSNVIHWEWCEDMRDAYAKTKLIIVPSRWEEPFGRVPAEAMVSGIPCVVSNRGGLPEVVADTGEVVTEINTIDQWIGSIQDAFETHEPDAQKRQVKKFSAEKQIEKLSKLIGELKTS